MTTPPKKTASKSAAKNERGNLKPTEIKPLVIAARKAFDFQSDLGNIEAGEDFNVWRHAQCLAVVGKPGITACSHDHYRPLMAHFQILAGRDENAFQNLTTTGQASKQHEDTHERRRNLANSIMQALRAHIKAGGEIREGYVVYLVRQKTRRPDMILGKDLATGLTERCTVKQLTQIRDTIVNRISAKEGVGSPITRNKAQSTPATKLNPPPEDSAPLRW